MSPLVIGIAGGTGSGKTTVARKICENMPDKAVNTLEHDSYYRNLSDLSYEQACELNFDHPDALETTLLIEHLKLLRQGESVQVPIYDFTTHSRRADSRHVDACPVIVVEGILVRFSTRRK